MDVTQDEPFQYWSDGHEDVCVCELVPPEQPETGSVEQLRTVCEFVDTYLVISLLNQPLPIEWHPLPKRPISSLEQLPVVVVFVCVVDVTQTEPFQYSL